MSYVYEGKVTIKRRIGRPSNMMDLLIKGLKNLDKYGISYFKESGGPELLYNNRDDEFYADRGGVALAVVANINYRNIKDDLYNACILDVLERDKKYELPGYQGKDRNSIPYGVYRISSYELRSLPSVRRYIPPQIGLVEDGEVKYHPHYDCCESAFDEFLHYFSLHKPREFFRYFDIKQSECIPHLNDSCFEELEVKIHNPKYTDVLNAVKDDSWKKCLPEMEKYMERVKVSGY